MPLDQNRLIVQARLTSSPLREAFEKQVKTIDDQEKDKEN